MSLYQGSVQAGLLKKGFVAAMLLSGILFITAQRARAQSLTIAGNTTVETLDAKMKETLVIPLKAENVDPANIRLEGVQPAVVLYNKSATADLKRAFTITYNAVLCQLEVLVDKAQLPRPGNYDLSVQFNYTDAAGVKKTGKVPFTIAWPAATLENLVQVNLIKIDNGKSSGEPIQLRETVGKADVNDLNFSVAFIPDQPRPDLLDFKKTDKALAAGTAKSFSYVIDQKAADRLKDGETNFTATINSKALSAPVKVSFKVIKNEWKGLILVAVVLGLLLSFLLKTALATKIADTKAEENGTQLKLELESFKADIQDVPMKQDIDELLKQTTDALAELDSFFADHTQTPQKLQTIRSNFEIKRQAFTVNINAAIITLLNAREALRPPGAERYLTAGTQDLITIGERLDQKDLSGANLALGNLNAHLADSIQLRKAQVAAFFDFLRLAGHLPKDLPELPAWVTDAGAKYEERLTGATLTGTDYPGLIRALVKLENDLQHFPELFLGTVADAYQDLDRKAARVPAFHDALNAWSEMIRNIARDLSVPPRTSADDGTLLDQLDKAWAAAKVPGNQVASDRSAGGMERSGAFSLKKLLGFKPEAPDAAGDPLTFAVSPASGAELTKIRLSKIRSNYIWLAILRYAIFILLISAAAYRAYEATFIGTWQQFLGIMLSAMTIDIAAEGVTQLNNKVSV